MSTGVIRQLNTFHTRCRTGCVGVCLCARTVRLKRGPRVRFYFQVVVGAAFGQRRCLRFRIDTLGREVAFRRAVRARAEYEIAVSGLREARRKAK